MRWLALLLLLPLVQASSLQDAAGDVGIQHCDVATTPAQGFEAMDILLVGVNETPDHIGFTVEAAGLEAEAGPDSGNYFVHFLRGDQHYALRMFQANSGTGAVTQLIRTEGLSVFGQTIAELPAAVDGAAHAISTAVPRHLLLDHDGAVPIRGHAMTGIMASAEAHATGVYFCSYDGSDGGPAIIQDRAPDSFDPADGATLTFRYGGATAEGPVRVDVVRPFRASNGEATTYAFQVTVANNDTDARAYDVQAQDLPPDWSVIRPNGTLVVGAGQQQTFPLHVRVPFQHQHGTTAQFDLVVAAQDGSSRASHQLGVHYLATPQPAGHHATVHLHSMASLSIATPLDETFGGGGHNLYFNTLEEDTSDQRVPVANQRVGDDLAWFGCLLPRLALGLSPDPDATGSFEFRFAADVETTGTLHGRVRVVAPEERGATCQMARDWAEGHVLMTLEQAGVSLDGTVNGALALAFQQDIPYVPGTDLLLEVRLTPDRPLPVGGTVDLLGGSLTLPLADHHDPAPVEPGAPPAEGFVPSEQPPKKDSPGLAPVALLGVAACAAVLRRR